MKNTPTRSNHEPSNVLNQDNSQLIPEGQLSRSCTLGMAPARRRGTRVSKRGDNRTARSHSQPNFQQRDQGGYRTTARRQLQHHAPLTQHTHERGRCQGDLQAQFQAVEAAGGSTHGGVLQNLRLPFYFLPNATNKDDNSSATPVRFGDGDRRLLQTTRALCGP